MKLGLFGGSFDPIHWGHIRPILSARAALGLDRVLFLPTARPPHKQEQKLVSPFARFTMVELALLEFPELEACDFEMRLERPSYTIETLEHFRAELAPADRLFLLIGADSFETLPSWRRWQELQDFAELVVMTRPGVGVVDHPVLRRERLHFIENQPLAISSRDLRRRLAALDAPGEDAVPRLVLDYLSKYRLYT
jgi:nicotinate-nucleotide adenylyltransferase